MIQSIQKSSKRRASREGSLMGPNIYEHQSAKSYITSFLKQKDQKKGISLRAFAKKTRIPHTTLSEYLSGRKNSLSVENTFKIAHFLGLNGEERDFFTCLIARDSSKDEENKKIILERLENIKNKKIENHHDECLETLKNLEVYRRFYYINKEQACVRILVTYKDKITQTLSPHFSDQFLNSISGHGGSGHFIKKENGKYKVFIDFAGVENRDIMIFNEKNSDVAVNFDPYGFPSIENLYMYYTEHQGIAHAHMTYSQLRVEMHIHSIKSKKIDKRISSRLVLNAL